MNKRFDKDTLIDLYITHNKTINDIASVFNCSTATVKRALRDFCITKPKELHYAAVKNSNIQKYGVDSVAKLESTKKKRESTNLKLYGTKCSLSNKEIRKKAEETCLNNNGVRYAFQSKDIQQKAKKTLLKNYGVTVPTKSVIVREKIQKTNIDKYGVISSRQAHIQNKELWFNDEQLKKYIISGNAGSKWKTHDLCKLFNTSISNVNKRINELSLREYIDSFSSKEEEQICAFLTENGIKHTKFRDGNFELDIYIPEKNIAIEFNGNYWHSTDVRPNKQYHLNKTKESESRGIFLYHIFEYDWYNKTELVLNQLKNILGLNTQTIYARKCTIQPVSSKIASNFQDINHLHGNTQASVKLGLFYKNELVSLMTFGKPRFSNEAEWELVRFCSKAGTNVVGGASRLFKHFVKMFNTESIVSYSDVAHTKGSLYRTLGFIMCGNTPSNYVWVNHNKVLSRYKCQKHKLIQNGFSELEKTEDAIMKARGYVKVYDCGNRKHIWYRNK